MLCHKDIHLPVYQIYLTRINSKYLLWGTVNVLFSEFIRKKELQQTKIWNVHSPTSWKKHFLYFIKANEKIWIHFQIPLLNQPAVHCWNHFWNCSWGSYKLYPTGFSHSWTMWEKWAGVKSFWKCILKKSLQNVFEIWDAVGTLCLRKVFMSWLDFLNLSCAEWILNKIEP